ncbi:MAG: hypothetical protein VXZ96_18145 [Myxococcota bacterium]|nr:hypothetical protein [Myxococcota bacterium]
MNNLNRKLGPYLIQETISVGSRSTLYRAVNPKPGGGDFGIRVLNSPNDPMDSKLLLHEYHSHNALKGRFTPQVVGIYRGEGALVYRWVSGVSLKRVIDAHREGLVHLNVKSVVEICCQVASAFHELHTHPEARRPPIYGRLNADHVLLSRVGTTVLLGMGRQLYNSDKNYRSPEQAAVAFVDWRTDQWSLGALMVELLLQTKLYHNQSNLQQALLKGDVSYWTQAVGQRWPILEPVLTRMLSANAGERYSDERRLVNELRAIHQKLDGRVECRAISEALIQSPPHGATFHRQQLGPPPVRRQADPPIASQDITEPLPVFASSISENNAPPKLQPRKKAKLNLSSDLEFKSMDEAIALSDSMDATEKIFRSAKIEADWDESSDMEFSEWDSAFQTAEEPITSPPRSQIEDEPPMADYTPNIPPVPYWLEVMNMALLVVFTLLALLHIIRIAKHVF